MSRTNTKPIRSCSLSLQIAVLLMVAGTMWAQDQDQNGPAAGLIVTNAKLYPVDKQLY